MTYPKPSMKYTDMAKWIDDNIYQGTADTETAYEYLYQLSNMLAHQNEYFQTAEQYDQFSLYAASRLYMRLTNKKQFEYTDDGYPKMKIIKSILNYLKHVIYPFKVDFELEFMIESKHMDVTYASDFDLATELVDNTSLFDSLSFSIALSSIDSIVRAHLMKIPRKKKDPEWVNIYISCMLTLLDSMTLSNDVLQQYSIDELSNTKLFEKLHKELKNSEPILFHLDPSMKNYIRVLVRELRHVLASELSWKSESYMNSDDTIKNLLFSSFNKEDT